MGMALTREQLARLTDSDLRSINRQVVDEINQRSRMKQRQAAAQFTVGQEVAFHSDKRGEVVRMTITRINQKTISGTEVGRPLNQWRVAPSMLIPACK